jgi:hypothetical protein
MSTGKAGECSRWGAEFTAILPRWSESGHHVPFRYRSISVGRFAMFRVGFSSPFRAPGSPVLSPPLRKLSGLSDRELLARVKALVSRERATTLEILLHLIEVERRRLHLGLGYPSLFEYCTRHLGYSSTAAGLDAGPGEAGACRNSATSYFTAGWLSKRPRPSSRTSSVSPPIDRPHRPLREGGREHDRESPAPLLDAQQARGRAGSRGDRDKEIPSPGIELTP